MSSLERNAKDGEGEALGALAFLDPVWAIKEHPGTGRVELGLLVSSWWNKS